LSPERIGAIGSCASRAAGQDVDWAWGWFIQFAFVVWESHLMNVKSQCYNRSKSHIRKSINLEPWCIFFCPIDISCCKNSVNVSNILLQNKIGFHNQYTLEQTNKAPSTYKIIQK
jgi:hypothetical protein